MPRNACQECRSRKIKCVIPRAGETCERCIFRRIPCSNVYSARPSHAEWSRGHGSRSSANPQGQDQSSLQTFRQPAVNSIYAIRGDDLPEILSGYDIGTGTPSDILREVELSKDILKLYFANFSDIHFMFDEDRFLREFDLGEVQKVVLFSMMALGVKYSDASVFNHIKASHRGEPFFREARRMLKENFDHISLTTIQVAGMASNMAKALRLTDDPLSGDPIRLEDCRRALCTVVLMDRTLSPSLNMTCYFSSDIEFKEPSSEEEFKRVGLGIGDTSENLEVTPNLNAAIFQLSLLFCQICTHHRQGVLASDLQAFEQRYGLFILDGSLAYTRPNFEMHARRGSLRKFQHFHLSYHHIGQLIYFSGLSGGHERGSSGLGNGTSRVEQCYYHANRICEIVKDGWEFAGLDVHNISAGQTLTVAASVHMHACLTATSMQQREAHQTKIVVITDCFARLRRACRVFDRISVQLDTFLGICRRDSSQRIFNSNERLLSHILHYGTSFERVNSQKTGRIINLESSAASSPGRAQQQQQQDPTNAGAPPSVQEQQQQDQLQDLDWLANGEDPEHYAWLFSESSLNDLYSMAYIDSDGFAGTMGMP